MNVASTSHRSNQKKNSSGKFAPSKEQSAKAERLVMQRNREQRLASCEALFAVHLADPESDLAKEIAEGDHYLSVPECNEYYKLLKAPNEVEPIDESAISFIRTEEDADSYFRDEADNYTREFKVVVETPTQTRIKSDFFIRVYFPTQHAILKVQFLKVLPFLDDY